VIVVSGWQWLRVVLATLNLQSFYVHRKVVAPSALSCCVAVRTVLIGSA